VHPVTEQFTVSHRSAINTLLLHTVADVIGNSLVLLLLILILIEVWLMIQTIKVGESSETLYLTGDTDKFSAMNVPKQCPLVLLVKEG
jgi:hypothetical protein